MKKILILISFLLLAITVEGQMIINARTPARAVVATETLGDELIPNGSFDSGTGWVMVGGTWTISGGVASIAGIDNANMIYPAASCVTGHTYRITFTIVSWTSGNFYIACEGGGTGRTTTRASTGTWTEDVVAAGNGNFYFNCESNGGTMSIDNISIKEVL
jgi:formylmethanofuran dehydrogenase subunit C